MNNFLFFTTGYATGYLTHKYQSTILYNSYKFYAIAKQHWDEYEKLIRYSDNIVKINPTEKEHIMLRIDNEQPIPKGMVDFGFKLDEYKNDILPVCYKYGIESPVSEYLKTYYNGQPLQCYLLLSYSYKHKNIYTMGKQQCEDNIENKIIKSVDKEDVILSADLVVTVNNNDDITHHNYDITWQLNSLLACDSYFMFVGDLKKVYWYIFTNDKTVNLKNITNINLEYMSRQYLTVETLKNGLIMVKDSDISIVNIE
jgi:hypothetical protein